MNLASWDGERSITYGYDGTLRVWSTRNAEHLSLLDSAGAAAHLAWLDAALAARTGTVPEMQTVMRARASVLSLSEVLNQHAVYFGTGAQG